MKTVCVTITVKVQGSLDEDSILHSSFKGEVAELRIPLGMLAGDSSDLVNIFTELVKAAGLRFTGTKRPARGWDQP